MNIDSELISIAKDAVRRVILKVSPDYLNFVVTAPSSRRSSKDGISSRRSSKEICKSCLQLRGEVAVANSQIDGLQAQLATGHSSVFIPIHF